MQIVRCCKKSCGKVVGEIQTGTARFKCKSCGTLTTVTIEKDQPAPQSFQNRIDGMTKKSGSAQVN